MRSERGRIVEFINRENIVGLICVMPFLIGFLLFTIVPMAMSLYYSFCDYDILTPPTFVGFKNYIEMFTADPTYIKSLQVTFFYTVVAVPLRLLFALIVAMLLVKSTKVTGVYRALYYLPSIIGGSVAVSILWKRIFATDGVFNSMLGVFGIDSSFAWLGNTSTAIWVIIILAVWQFGSSMLIFLSALKQIPGSYYEAGKVDGATNIGCFFKITLPLLTPTIFFNLVMQMIQGFLAFTQCFIITQGKPMNSTLFYTVYMYQQSFEYRNMGYGSAMAWVMLIIVSVFTLLLFKTKKFWVYEEAK